MKNLAGLGLGASSDDAETGSQVLISDSPPPDPVESSLDVPDHLSNADELRLTSCTTPVMNSCKSFCASSNSLKSTCAAFHFVFASYTCWCHTFTLQTLQSPPKILSLLPSDSLFSNVIALVPSFACNLEQSTTCSNFCSNNFSSNYYCVAVISRDFPGQSGLSCSCFIWTPINSFQSWNHSSTWHISYQNLPTFASH
jgi:hypothetical protein